MIVLLCAIVIVLTLCVIDVVVKYYYFRKLSDRVKELYEILREDRKNLEDLHDYVVKIDDIYSNHYFKYHYGK